MANNSSDAVLHLLQRYSMDEVIQKFVPTGFMAERVVPPIWYVIGFIGNPLSAIVWLDKRIRRNNSSAVYLGALSISDLIFLFLNLIFILQVSWGRDLYNAPVICEIFNVIYYIPQYLSTFLVLGFTTERYIAVCYPFLKEKVCTVRRAICVVIFLTIFATALASAQGYIWTYDEVTGVCGYRSEALEGGDWSFWNVWNWTTDIFAFILVPLVVLLLNILVLREIIKISRNDVMKRQHSGGSNSTASTVTLLAVSFYLIITQVSATVVALLQNAFPYGDPFLTDEQMLQDENWSALFTYFDVRKTIEVLCLSHYACYFFIYCFTGKHFRKQVLFLFTFKGRLPFLATLVSKKRRKERYSMVSTNGGPISETYATNITTSI